MEVRKAESSSLVSTEDHISRRELCQFVCGLIAGQIGVSRRVDQARQFQKRIKDQLERLYTQLGMPDGKRLVGRRFSRLQSKSFLRALEAFAMSTDTDNAAFSLIAEFVSRPNVIRQLHVTHDNSIASRTQRQP